MSIPKLRAQQKPVWNVFVFTFIPLWIRQFGPANGMTSDRNLNNFSSQSRVLEIHLLETSIRNNTMTEIKSSRFDLVLVSYINGAHAGHIQQIFSQYCRLAFPAELRWKIETFIFQAAGKFVAHAPDSFTWRFPRRNINEMFVVVVYFWMPV